MDRPASTGFMPSLDSTAASRSLIISPLRTTSVSLLTHTLPDSILVGNPTELSWLIIGPGGCPVFPAGTVTSIAAVSPDLAVVLTLPLSSRIASLNGLRSVKRKRFDPSKYSSSFLSSVVSMFSRAILSSVFFRTRMETLPVRFFFSSWSCAARTFCRLAMPMDLYEVRISCISLT